MISVIIPVFNAEKYIERLLNSIINQTYKDLDIIVVNDGCTDGTMKVVEKFKNIDSRIRIINKENGGVSSARNLGIDNAIGDYISFIDADDWLEINFYERLIFTIEKENVDVVRCNYIKNDSDNNFISAGNISDIAGQVFNTQEVKERCIPKIFENTLEAYMPLLFIKSEIVKKIPKFDTSICMMEDLLYYIELLVNVDSVYFLDEKLYHYCVNLNSSSKKRSNYIRNLNSTLSVVKIIKEKLNKHELLEENMLKEINYIYSTMVVKYIFRTFLKDDEFRLTYDEFYKICAMQEIENLIKNVDFSNSNDYIKKGGELLIKKEYEKLYNYGLELFDKQVVI